MTVYPANFRAVNTLAISPLPAANEGPRAAHPSSQGRGFSVVYAVDGSYNNDVTYSVYGIHRSQFDAKLMARARA